MKKNTTREAILKAALECFAKNGYVNTSMNDIVKYSGISKGGIYWHFKSKEEMFVEMIEEEYENWLNIVSSSLASLSDPIEKIRKYGQLFYSKVDVPIYKMIPESYFGEVGEHYRDRLNKWYSQDDEMLLDIFSDAISRDLIRIADPKALTWIYISTMEGLFAELCLQSDNKEELEAYFEQAIDIFIQGIKK